jgi:lipopolysaccharide export system protein LptA
MRVSFLRGIGALALLAGVPSLFVPTAAQGKHPGTVKKPVRPKGRLQEPAGRAKIGDIMVSGYETGEIVPGEHATLSGANTLIEFENKENKSTGTLRARNIEATFVAKTRNKIEKIVASTNVHFHASRPQQIVVEKKVVAEGPQIIDVQGSRGTYLKESAHLDLEGPVRYTGEQPSASGTKETVSGVADHATYDEKKQILTLTGNVSYNLTTAGIEGPLTATNQRTVVVYMGEKQMRISIKNAPQGRIEFEPKQKPKEPEKKSNDTDKKP